MLVELLCLATANLRSLIRCLKTRTLKFPLKACEGVHVPLYIWVLLIKEKFFKKITICDNIQQSHEMAMVQGWCYELLLCRLNAIRSNLSICQNILKKCVAAGKQKNSIKYVRGPPDIICLSRRLLEGGRRGHPNTSERKAEWYLMSSAAPMHAYQRVAFTFLFSSSPPTIPTTIFKS